MKRGTLSLPLLVLFLLTVVIFLLAPSAIAQGGENEVSVYFATQYNLPVDGDSFSNKETTGQTIWRIPNIINNTDESGEKVRELHVKLESDLEFEWVSDRNLVTTGPPVYEWHFGDLEEEHRHTGWATDVLVGFLTKSPTTFTPGLDVSRSFDKTVFTEPGTQIVTVTVTPRVERIESVEIFVHARDDELVDSDIISHSAGSQAHITADRNFSEVGQPGVGIPVEIDKTISISVTMQVTPKVPELEFKPHVGIKPNWQQTEPYSDTSLGSSISYTNEAGIWTVSAEGNYLWHWAAGKEPGYDIDFRPWVNVPTTSEVRSSRFPVWAIIVIAIALGLGIFFFVRRRRRITT